MTKRRTHSPGFKAKVALATLKGDKTLAELSHQYNVHPTQIKRWREQWVSQADRLFDSKRGLKQEATKDVDQWHAKMGELTMEKDCLARGLERIHGPFARR